MFPVSWQSTTAGKVGNPWHVNPAANYSYVVGNGSTFSVEFDGISDSGCAQLVGFYVSAASSANGGQVPGLIGSAVSTAAPTAGTAKLGTVAATYAGAPSICVGGGTKDSVEVSFDMSIM